MKRSPYSSALKAATKRLKRARVEKQKCEEKLTSLNVEIPRLEQIISVLSPASAKPVTQGSYIEDLTGMVSIPVTQTVADGEDDPLPDDADAKGWQ